MDFRNKTIEDVDKILKNHGFNDRAINNFKNAFRNQDINDFSLLKGIKRIKKIAELLPFQPLKLIKSVSDKRKNEKFIFQTHDMHFIESVLMPDKKNISICVSVQAGCRFKCAICRTGRIGFKRNLFCHEILEQIRQINLARILPNRISCISFMGMGEPLDNLSNAMLALEWINSNFGWQISREKVTFSTSACRRFDDFFKYEKLPNLAISLHSAIEAKRKKIVPNSACSLKKIAACILEYHKRERKQVSIEYCLIKGINDSQEDAILLSEYLKELPCKVNLLNYNSIDNSNFLPCSPDEVMKFKEILQKKNITAIYRKSLGTEICAGCGQLGGSNSR